jgi:hypothetical protein
MPFLTLFTLSIFASIVSRQAFAALTIILSVFLFNAFLALVCGSIVLKVAFLLMFF